MGSLFKGRSLLNIRRPKYKRLKVTDLWIGLDDDEEDELIDVTIARQFPSEVNNHECTPEALDNEEVQDNHNNIEEREQFQRLTIEVPGDEDESFLYDRRMLDRQGSPLYKTFAARHSKSCGCNKLRLFYVLLSVVIGVTIVCLFYFLLPCPSSTLMSRSEDFSINITGSTETTIRLFDVNRDGIQDIIYGYARLMTKLHDDEMQAFCRFINMTEPCAGAVAAADGKDGTLLWELNVESEVYAILCDQLDANGDGQNDCLVTGRMGVFYAVDSTNGASIWSADPTVSNSSWNFYQPQVVPDLDGDGVVEVVVAHGGNGEYSSEETNRDANRILLLSGKTGKSLGKYLETPDKTETYSAVSVYKRQNGAIYVLFGTGGETVKGSLWTISLQDLFCHAIGKDAGCSKVSQVPALVKGNYKTQWGKNPLKVTVEGVREIIRSNSDKGVMVPTVFVDMNQDGTLDVLVSLFNGTVALLDGEDLSIIWSTGNLFGEFETYSIPAPGHFNSDDVPDVMIRLSHGTWSGKYNSTMIFILDGKDGQILWSTQSHSDQAVMSSPLSVRGKDNKDIFLFWIQGRRTIGTEFFDFTGMGHLPQRDGKNDRRHERHGDEGASKDDCDTPLVLYENELLLMNRNFVHRPLQIAMVNASKYYYNATEEAATVFDKDKYSEDSNPDIPHNKRENKPAKPTTQAQHKTTTSPHANILFNITVSDTEPSEGAGHESGVTDISSGTDIYLSKFHSASEKLATSSSVKPIPYYTGHPFEDDDDDDFYPGPDLEEYPPLFEAFSEREMRCSIYSTWSRSTGTIGDLDNDGILDIVYILSYMVILKDATGSYMGLKSYLTLIKKSMVSMDNFVTLDPQRTFCDASIKSEPVKDHMNEEFGFLLQISNWLGYMGTRGESYYDGYYKG